jgi:tRNA (guanosine-2'-O-)-methyltransferase
MRRDKERTFELPRETELPAAPHTVIEALEPLLTDERRARIDRVIAARTRGVVPVLEGVDDPHNVAAVMRSAEAFGVQEVHVVDGSQGFVAARSVAQGTERWIDVQRHATAQACVTALRDRGYRVYVAAMDGALSPEDLAREARVAVVFGNEHAGVSAEMRALADGTYAIPMRGFVESLNVSVAAAITLYGATQGRAGNLSDEERKVLRARYVFASVPRGAEIVAEYLRRRSA